MAGRRWLYVLQSADGQGIFRGRWLHLQSHELTTNYQNGVDFHLDMAAAQFLSKQLFIGPVGYVYDQVSADRGSAPILGAVDPRVLGVGPQLGYLFPVGNMQGFLNLKAYFEWDNHDRPAADDFIADRGTAGRHYRPYRHVGQSRWRQATLSFRAGCQRRAGTFGRACCAARPSREHRASGRRHLRRMHRSVEAKRSAISSRPCVSFSASFS
jgi:hypothetical protein